MISNKIIEYFGSLFCFHHFLLEFHGTHEIDYMMANCGAFRYETWGKTYSFASTSFNGHYASKPRVSTLYRESNWNC